MGYVEKHERLKNMVDNRPAYDRFQAFNRAVVINRTGLGRVFMRVKKRRHPGGVNRKVEQAPGRGHVAPLLAALPICAALYWRKPGVSSASRLWRD